MRPSSMTPGHARAARLAYVAVILVATLSNLHFDPALADVPFRLHRALDISPHLSDAIDAVRNIVLFAGLGAVWVATSRLSKPASTLLAVTVISMLLSSCVEALQLFSPVRNSSLIDVTTNTLGGLVGGLATLGAFNVIHEGARKRSYIGIPAIMFAVSYGLATIMEAFIPLFRQDLLPQLGGSILDRIGRAIDAIQLSSIGQLPFTDLFIFLPAGVFGAAALMESGVSGPVAATVIVVIAAGIYPLVEVVHGVAALPIILGAALIHVVAVSLGAIVAALFVTQFARRFPIRRRAGLVAIAYSLVIMVWSWRPFRLELSRSSLSGQFTADHIIPLQALASRGDLFSVTDVIAQGVIFFPLGALLAVWPLARRGAFRGFLPAIYLAIILEVGKIPILDRFMDVTHILIQCAGAALGFVLLRRLRFKVAGSLLTDR
ncbi:MAG: VanZ family protein [Gemmatimonadaceae bacterium]